MGKTIAMDYININFLSNNSINKKEKKEKERKKEKIEKSQAI